MIIWGKQDKIVPVSAARVFNESIPGSDLVLLDNCGHRPEMSRPQRLSSVCSASWPKSDFPA